MENSKTQEKSHKHTPLQRRFKIIFGTLFCLLLIEVFFVGYQDGIHNYLSFSLASSSFVIPQTNTLLRGGRNAVQVSNDFTFPLLRVNGNIYIDEDSPYRYVPDPTTMKWQIIATAPYGIAHDNFQQVYSFKRFNLTPNGRENGLGFVMRWDAFHYEVYLYTENGKQNYSAKKVISFVAKTQDSKDSNVPRITQISADGTYVALSMYGCANCGSADIPADTLLLNVKTGATKRIGPTSFFDWKEGGNYAYKVYKETSCITQGTEENTCPVDLNVPTITGNI